MTFDYIPDASPANIDPIVAEWVHRELTRISDELNYSDLIGLSVFKFMSEFGAGPDNTDNTDAFQDAVDWLNDQDDPACLIFGEPGIYSYVTCPNWAVDHASIKACGVVRLRCTGSGDSFILDGGTSAESATGITDMHVGRFLIEGHDGSGDGVYIRAVHRSFFSFNVRGCGTSSAALRTEWCVVNEFQFTTSVNEGGWYNDGTGAAKPLYGAYLDERDPGESTSYCVFPNPIIEGPGTGCYIINGIGNTLMAGTLEACTDIGWHIGSNSLWNKCQSADFESNTNYDVYIEGDNNFLNGADTGFNSGVGIKVLSGAKGNQITGGSHSDIVIDAGAIGTFVGSGATVNRFGDGSSLSDSGTNSRTPDVYDYGNNTWL